MSNLTPELKEKFEAILDEWPFPRNGDKQLIDLMLAAYNIRDEWISVEDRLPEKDGRYLANVKSNSGIYDGGINFLNFDTHNGFGRATHKHVTHWQPIPSPPKNK